MTVYNCQRCSAPLRGSSVCSCGWYMEQNQGEKQADKDTIKSLVIISCLLLISGFYFFQWGGYSFSIIPHYLSGNHEKISEICMDLKKYDCVEEQYTKIFERNKDPLYLEKLAEFQFKREKYEDASQNYMKFFETSGEKGFRSMYYYAHALAKINEIDSAISYFESLIQKKENVLMVTVTESYLKILVEYNRVKKAKEVLIRAEKRAKNSQSAMAHVQRWKKEFSI